MNKQDKKKHFTFTKNSNTPDDSSIATKSQRLNNINLKATRNFLIRYKEVNNATWYVLEGGFKAEFTSGEVTTSVIYKENGAWLHTIKRYNENSLPKDIRAIVKRTYYDYTITNVEEVEVPDRDGRFFFVHVQDASCIKILRVYDGEMQIFKAINKNNGSERIQ